MNNPVFPPAAGFVTLPRHAHAPAIGMRDFTPWGSEIQRILCVRLDNLGDLLMTTPALHALKTGAPGRHLTLLTSPAGAAAAPFIPDVDEVIVAEVSWMKGNGEQHPFDDLRLLHRLRHEHYDAAVLFNVYSQSPLPAAQICYLAGIPRRLAHCRENPYLLLSDWIPEPEPQHQLRHEVARQLALVASVGARAADTGLRFVVPESARQTLAQRLHVSCANARRALIVLHPGASAESRRYPAKYFAQAAAELIRATGCEIVITGSAAERSVATGIASEVAQLLGTEPAVRVLAGELSLGELGALLERADLLLANNSGPVHVASALGTPVVVLYALTNPQHTPWQTPNRVLFQDVECRWCYKSLCPEGHHACLRGVPPETVVAAAQALLNERLSPVEKCQIDSPVFMPHLT